MPKTLESTDANKLSNPLLNIISVYASPDELDICVSKEEEDYITFDIVAARIGRLDYLRTCVLSDVRYILLFRVASKYGQLKTVRYILNTGWTPSRDITTTALIAAAENNQLVVLRELKKYIIVDVHTTHVIEIMRC